jgi:hypothetical protein
MKKKVSRVKMRMLKERKKPKNYDSEEIRQAYETKTEWISKARKKKE